MRACSTCRTWASSILTGARVREFLRGLLANDVGRLKSPGQGAVLLHAAADGGVIDDLIVYFLSETWFRLVVNAGTRDKDLAWIRGHAAAFRRERARAHAISP